MELQSNQLAFAGGDGKNFSYKVQTLVAHSRGDKSFKTLKHFDKAYRDELKDLKIAIENEEDIPPIEVEYIAPLKVRLINEDGKKRVAAYYTLKKDIPIEIKDFNKDMVLEEEVFNKGEDTSNQEEELKALEDEIENINVSDYPSQEEVDGLIEQKQDLIKGCQYHIDNAPKDSITIKKLQLYIG